MLQHKNSAGFKFVWPDYSDYVEVYHSNASFADLPFEVVDVSHDPRDMSTLKVLADQTSEYSKPLER